jgi:hypothetical protein
MVFVDWVKAIVRGFLIAVSNHILIAALLLFTVNCTRFGAPFWFNPAAALTEIMQPNRGNDILAES